MSPVLVSLTNFTFGVPSDESGINIDTFSRKYMAKKIRVPDKLGSARGKVYYDFTIDGTLNGESIGSGGLMAATIGAFITIVNTIYGFGINSGGAYLDECTLTLNREKLQVLDIRFSVDPQIS